MPSLATFLTNLKSLYKQNPWVAFAFVWVTVIPAVGSMVLLSYLYRHDPFDEDWQFPAAILFTLAGAVAMGFALCPTTLLAITAGYLWGWLVFPLVVVSYTLASLIGYFSGLAIDKNSLKILLQHYPKAQMLFGHNKHKLGTLIFFTRISPVIPFALSNLLFALIKAGWKNVMLYGIVGMLPRTLLSFSIGLAANSLTDALSSRSSTVQLLFFALFLAISSWGIARYYQRSLHKG